MRTLLLSLVFVVCLIAAGVAFTPLGFVLERSGAGNAGAGWAQAEGTLMEGRISGLHVAGQPIGDVNLKLHPMSLLTLAPKYDVQWGGAGSSGSGVITISQSSISAEDLRLQQNVSAIEGLALPVRAIGGTLRLTGGEIQLTRSGCDHAAGELTTDVLTRAAQQYGRQFGSIDGPLTCIEGNILTSLNGLSERGDTVRVDTETSISGASALNVVIETMDSDVMFALSQSDFVREGEAWIYHYETGGVLSQ